MKKYNVIGIMSGTSLDGLDIAYCELEKEATWKYKILKAETVMYNKEWRQKLSSAFRKSRKEISKLDVEYGKFIGKKVRSFIRRHKLKPDFISSHGHTVFHQPEKKFTLQIGSGKMIARICHLPAVCDFRSADVRLGGQGAPLVPIGDEFLFPEYDFCLNLGGIANISYKHKAERIAFDICPVNIVLNYLSCRLGKQFDKDGKTASSGTINRSLLSLLNALPYYRQSPPKSLGREWIERNIFPVLNSFNISIPAQLRTFCEHIAIQISAVVNRKSVLWRMASVQMANRKLFITGGGAYNKFLVKLIREKSKCEIILPAKKTIEYKEALVFALMGTLRMRNEINIFRSVTGTKRDHTGGKIFFPPIRFRRGGNKPRQ